jgi:hypothetical protein
MKQPPVAPASRKAPPATDVLPFVPGQIVGSVPISAIRGQSDLTDAERAVLQSGGYRDGDPVPDLANTAASRKLRAQAARVAEEAADIRGLTPIDPTTPPLTSHRARNVKDMSPDEQSQALSAFREMDELQQKLKEARVRAAAAAAEEAEIPAHMAAIPGYMAAMSVANEAPDVELVDDIDLAGGKPKLRMRVAVEPKPAPEPAPAVAGSDLSGYAVSCPRCNHNLNGPLYEPTTEDKVAYIALIMGEQKRFRRAVALFGGRLKVVFRSLLTSEEDMAFRQADADIAAGKISNLLLYTVALEDYKMLMSIESVQRAGKAAISVAPISDYEYDEETNRTPLPEFKRWLDDEVFLAASVRNAVVNAYHKFSEILRYMDVKAPDDPFFDGIG